MLNIKKAHGQNKRIGQAREWKLSKNSQTTVIINLVIV